MGYGVAELARGSHILIGETGRQLRSESGMPGTGKGETKMAIANDVYRWAGVESGGQLPSCVWPGGCPVLYQFRDGEVCCATCVNGSEVRDAAELSDWSVVMAYVYYEGPPGQCANCGTLTESAYGDPGEVQS